MRTATFYRAVMAASADRRPTEAKRVTAAPFGGTCGQLRKVAEAIAVDLGAWLRDPRSGARLGDQ